MATNQNLSNKMKLTSIYGIFLLALIAMLSSCDSKRVFEKNTDFEKMEWTYENPAAFDFSIKDNAPKNLLVNVRHTFHFEWRNIWMKMAITFPNDSVYEMPLNIQLSQPNGKWFGKCTGDICFFQYTLPEYENYTFQDTGKYTIVITQDMRQNPLPEIMSIGLRVENAQKP